VVPSPTTSRLADRTARDHQRRWWAVEADMNGTVSKRYRLGKCGYPPAYDAAVPDVRELARDETPLAAAALLELRPALGSADALVARADAQREAGYRLVASFEAGDVDAAGVAGFRVSENLAWGLHLYVDDLVTRADRRGRGHGRALLQWLAGEAERCGCGQLHLDSGVGPERQAAHRIYFAMGMRISAHHFSRDI
jgi:GNAT superfamily N-acetyltransferase